MEIYQKGRSYAISIITFGLIIFGVGVLGLGFTFDETEYIKYGGDAYTGIQNAAADAANNIAKACGVLCSVIGFLSALGGQVLLNYFNIKKFEMEETNRRYNEILLVLKEKANSTNTSTNNEIISNLKEKVDNSTASSHDEKKETKTQYQCSLCRNIIAYGAKECDKCGAVIDWNLKQ